MKKNMALLVVAITLLAVTVGCGSNTNNSVESNESGSKVKNVAVSLADSTDYYIGTMVGNKITDTFKKAGAKVDVLDGASSVTTQIQQIQNAVTKGADLIYVFPTGDAEAYTDTLRDARKAGVKVLVSNVYPGDGAFDAYVGSEEFYMGAMMASMVSNWIDNTLPQATKVKALILEAHLNETMAHRNLGMRLISEKFLREADIKTMYFIKKQGQPVNYKDSNGNVQQVDEPTGGLILDQDGYAILNPFFDSRVVLIENSNRVSTGYTATEAQAALESAVTQGNSDLNIIMTYGDLGISMSDKVIEMSRAGTLKNELKNIAVFGSDATEANLKAISQSANNSTVFRGVMAAGDLVNTLCVFAEKMVAGEEVPDVTMEPLSYVMADSTGKTKTVLYTDVTPLVPEIDKFFK